jgi:hypothetical protein
MWPRIHLPQNMMKSLLLSTIAGRSDHTRPLRTFRWCTMLANESPAMPRDAVSQLQAKAADSSGEGIRIRGAAR